LRPVVLQICGDGKIARRPEMVLNSAKDLRAIRIGDVEYDDTDGMAALTSE
jgi:hypothetical protein